MPIAHLDLEPDEIARRLRIRFMPGRDDLGEFVEAGIRTDSGHRATESASIVRIMGIISEEILRAERECALGVRTMDAVVREQLRERVFERYGRSRRLWHVIDECVSFQNTQGWRCVKDLVGEDECVLFFDLDDDVGMFSVPSGASLDMLLGETFGYVFYVTDMDASYLICFNDHDFLICCGNARPWLIEWL